MDLYGEPMGAHGAPSPPVVVRCNFEKFTKMCISPFGGSKIGEEQIEIEGGVDLSGEIRSRILHRTPPRISKMVGWRPIW